MMYDLKTTTTVRKIREIGLTDDEIANVLVKYLGLPITAEVHFEVRQGFLAGCTITEETVTIEDE